MRMTSDITNPESSGPMSSGRRVVIHSLMGLMIGEGALWEDYEAH